MQQQTAILVTILLLLSAWWLLFTVAATAAENPAAAANCPAPASAAALGSVQLCERKARLPQPQPPLALVLPSPPLLSYGVLVILYSVERLRSRENDGSRRRLRFDLGLVFIKAVAAHACKFHTLGI